MKLKLTKHIAAMALTVMAASYSRAGVGADFNTIPLPLSVAEKHGETPFSLSRSTPVAAPDSLAREASMLSSYLPVDCTGRPSGIIVLTANLYDASPEAYVIDVDSACIHINGASAAGLFYGIQTLRKAIDRADAEGGVVNIPAAHVYDRPRFPYRGMHLDVSRHFFTVDEIKSYLDMIALHGGNRFHMHLTDDQGWRIEIKRYPRLTEVGSRRPGTIIGRTGPGYDSIPVSGYYTHDDISEIVRYAADRHIMVIPEIDLPSHMLAALASYPELGCTGGPYEVWQRWGINENVLCPGNDSTMKFLEGVLTEVAELFPSPYIHIGGDECPRTRWEQCPKCQARIKELGIEAKEGVSPEAQLQGYVTGFACDVLRRHGKRAIGWDEILESEAPADAVIMSWHSVSGALEGTSRGHEVILTPSQYCYFDYFQSPDGPDEPFAVGGLNNVEHVYSLEPVLPSFTPEQQTLVLGCQANLWTEYIKTFDHVQYNVLPRLAALAEVQWTAPSLKDYDGFRYRLIGLMRSYDRAGYNYARHVADVAVDYEMSPDSAALLMTCTALPGYDIRYTLDGSEPTLESAAYTAPVKLAADAIIKVNAFSEEGRGGKVVSDTLRVNPLTFGRCTLVDQPYYVYAFKGAPQLVDGLVGTRYFRTGRWLGFSKKDLDATIEMRAPAILSEVSFNVVVKPVDALADASAATVYGRRVGSSEWVELASEKYAADDPAAPHRRVTHTLSFEPMELDAVRLVVSPVAMLPPDHPQGGWPALMFVDEISAR